MNKYLSCRSISFQEFILMLRRIVEVIFTKFFTTWRTCFNHHHIESKGLLVSWAALVMLCVTSQSLAFPTVYPTGVTINQASQTFNGYTIFSPTAVDMVYLIDMDGNILHTWDAKTEVVEPSATNGNILVQTLGEIKELNWDGDVVWNYTSDVCRMHHDVQRLENGNTLILCKKARYVPKISSSPIMDDYIIEVTPDGQIVWEWYTYEHYDEFGFSTVAQYLIDITAGDWAHTNSIQSLPNNSLNDPRFAPGNILVSQRNTNIIYIIDKNSGQIVWKVGPQDYLSIGQHQAKMIPEGLDGAGRILAFDNGGHGGYPLEVRTFSRVIEIDPLTKTIAQKYEAGSTIDGRFGLYSPFMSGAQKLPNGNTLIAEAWGGRILEINPLNEIVWEYVIPHVVTGEPTRIYRVFRVGPEWLPLLN